MFALRFGGPAHHSAPQLRRPEPFTGYANWAGLPALVNAQTGGRSSWDGPNPPVRHQEVIVADTTVPATGYQQIAGVNPETA